MFKANYNLSVSAFGSAQGGKDGKCVGCSHHRHLYGVYCCAHPAHGDKGWLKAGDSPNHKIPDFCPLKANHVNKEEETR